MDADIPEKLFVTGDSMPNRIIKESICTSENIDQLTAFQETAFVRLIVNCDDFGRFFGNPKILASRLFPLKDITADEMKAALNALVAADLVTVYEVDGKQFVQLKTWEDHQQKRATKSKFPNPPVEQLPEGDIDCNKLQSIDINCNQLQSDDNKCPRNRNRNTIYDNRYSESYIADDDAENISSEQNKVLDAAELAGFPRNDATRAKLIALYADHGLQKMLDGIASCVDHSASSIAYLSAVLKGEPKKQTKTVAAQDYTQRDYSDEQAEAMQRMIRGVS